MSTSTLIDDVTQLMSRNQPDDPAALYQRMIVEQPVLWCPVGDGFWIVSKHELANAVLTSKNQFVRGGRFTFDRSGQGSAVRDMVSISMVQLDEPDHSRLRSLVSQAFTPRGVRELNDIALQAIDRNISAAGGQADLVKDISYPFTIEMITSMMGLPFADGEKIVQWTQSMIGYGSSNDVNAARNADRAATEMHEYFLGYAAERSSGDGSDMISVLARAEADGDRLSKDELAAVCWELVGAGHETTANQIPAAVLAFLRNPDQLELLRSR
ncbi:MAG: cytochrome P450, partial [Rhodococcus fascians]